VAWSAVKKRYHKVGDVWLPRVDHGFSAWRSRRIAEGHWPRKSTRVARHRPTQKLHEQGWR
jgi:hypothetical protein